MTGDQPRRRAWWSACAVLVLVVVAVLVVLRNEPSTSDDLPDPSDGVVSDRTERARAAFADLEDAWDDRDRAAFLAAAGPSSPSRAWAAQTYDALATLDVEEIGLRYVGELATDTAAGEAGEFAAEVAVSWRPGGRPDPDYRTSIAQVPMRLADTGDDVGVLGLGADALTARADGGALPLWLAGELVESGTPQARCLGIGTDPDDIDCGRLARVAGRELAAVLPRDLRTRTGGLVIVLPTTVDQAAALLGRNPVALTQIAGVSTTVDASGSPEAPQMVVLNPERFEPLGRADRQFVATHESVHVATGAAAVVMPVWVAEGFADYVALLPGRIPLARAAEQALERVRRVGPPRSLPRDDDFGSAQLRLGEAYQQSWLVFRLLGERYGADAVVGFYEAVLDGARTEAALENGFGIMHAELTDAWRAELVRLAG